MKLFQVYLAIILATFVQTASAQPLVDWQLIGNVVAAGQFLGTTNPQPLHLQTMLGQPMRFRTNFGAAPLGAGNRMIITDGGFGNNGGQIAIGNNLPNVFVPADRFHIHQTGGPTNVRITANFTGNTATDGVSLGLRGIPPAAIVDAFEIHQWEDAPIDFFTNDPNVTVHDRKMRIWHDPVTNEPRVGIGFGANELTYLHLGGFLNTLGTGYRNWMNVGTLYSSANVISPDNMYVGLRQYGDDIVDAVINWGNNPLVSPVADRLRFVFTSFPGNGVASTNDGLELGRMIVQSINPGNVRGFVGFGDFFTNLTEPQNTVEILSPFPVNTVGGSSGLRFTNLTTASPTTVNPGLGVLAVDGIGDVIYVPYNFPFASVCGSATPSQLIGLSEVQLNNFDFHFSGQGGLNNNVGIGTNCVNPLNAKLHITQSSGNFGTIGSYIVNFDDAGTAFNQEVKGLQVYVPGVTSSVGVGQIAGQFITTGVKLNVSVDATATNFFPGNGTVNYASRNIATGGDINYGVFGNASGSLFANYAVYGSCLPSSGNTPPTGPNYAGYFDGDVVRTGSDNFTSDVSLKQNIQNVDDAMSLLMQLFPKTFYFDTAAHQNFDLPSKKQYGLIAQDVSPIFPELVSSAIHPPVLDSLGNIITPAEPYLTLNYQAFIPLLIKGMKEQQLLIDSLFQCSNLRTGSVPTQSITLESDIILYQNVPNPFSDETTIRYFIPENASNPRILFYDETGRMIKEESIYSLGNGTLSIKTSGLSSGIYSYSLEVSDKIVQTRKMQKIK